MVTSFWKFLIRIWWFLSSTAKRWRATKTADSPRPRLHSCEPPSAERPSRGTWYSSYEPPSASRQTSSMFSCSLKCTVRATLELPVPERRMDMSGTSLALAYSYERT